MKLLTGALEALSLKPWTLNRKPLGCSVLSHTNRRSPVTYIWSCALRPPPPMVSPPPPPPMICFKSANSHRDQPRHGRHPRNCRRFWSRKASILVTVVTFGPSCCRRASKVPKVPTVTGIGVVLIAILRTVLTFDPSRCRHASDVSTDYKCILFPPSELSSLLAPYVFVALQMYRQINNHRYKPSIEP